MKTMQNRLALSVALSLAVMAGSAYAASLKSTVGLKTDGTLENVSKIEATSSRKENTVTVTIKANGTSGGAYGVFSNMYSTTDNLDSYASNLNVVVSGSSFNATTSENAGGALAGPIVIEKNEDGIPVGGHVNIKMPSLNPANPQKAIDDANTVIRSAMAPADPSGQDYAVANQAQNIKMRAQAMKKEGQGSKLDIQA